MKLVNSIVAFVLFCFLPMSQTVAQVSNNLVDENGRPHSKIEVGFSPGGTALNTILTLINSARSDIHIAAYSFTSPDIVRALVAASKRGVNIQIVIDKTANSNNSSIAAMNLIVLNGIPLRTNSKFAHHHDKFIIVDRQSVQTGSFNYSRSADTRNSENVVVLYYMPEVAQAYLSHWQLRWSEGVDWKPTY